MSYIYTKNKFFLLVIYVKHLTSLYGPPPEKRKTQSDVSKIEVVDDEDGESSDACHKEECVKEEGWFIDNDDSDRCLERIKFTKQYFHLHFMFFVVFLFVNFSQNFALAQFLKEQLKPQNTKVLQSYIVLSFITRTFVYCFLNSYKINL